MDNSVIVGETEELENDSQWEGKEWLSEAFPEDFARHEPMPPHGISEVAVPVFAYEPPRPLAELYPDEIIFFAKRFIWAANRSGFYVRHGYPKGQGWYARKRQGETWMPVYPELANALIEKHLDFERFCKSSDWLGPLHPRIDETAFWVGMMMGEYSYHDCLDIDSHDRIGFHGVPSRFHPEKNGRGEWMHWHDYRMIPVMRIGLDYFKKLKLVHMNFPRRVWSFSSGSLGMYAYRMFEKAVNPEERYDAVMGRLRSLRMDVLGGVPVEVYPEPPKTEGSKGHQQRRPCGMDSGVITDSGIVTDPIEQIRVFMAPQTPSFDSIVEAVISRLLVQYRGWLAFPNDSDCPKQVLFDEQRAEIDRVRRWLDDGCPDLETVLKGPILNTPPPSCSISCGVLSDDVQDPEEEPGGPTKPSIDDMFVACDLVAIGRARQWVQFVIFLAEHGFPREDSFLPVVSTLTKWLYFYELYHLPDRDRRAEIKELLITYCLTKHNGFITRLNNGQVGDVESNVHRLVDHQIDTIDNDGKLTFLQMRSKRDRGLYQTIYEIVPLLTAPATQQAAAPIENETDHAEGWTYEPDDTPLPSPLHQMIVEAYEASGCKLRRNEDGEYPVLKAVTRLINYLSQGRSYHRRASQKLLTKMGFPSNSKKREKIKTPLYKHDIIIKGDYQALTRSRKYILTERVIDLLVEQRTATSA